MKKLSIVIIGVCLLFTACERKVGYDSQTLAKGNSSKTTSIDTSSNQEGQILTKQELESFSQNAFNSGDCAIQGDRIYFGNSYDDGKLYSMKTDGSDMHKLIDEWVQWFHVSGNLIYYQNSSDKICVMNIDGSNQHKLNDDKAFEINVADGKIYYNNDFTLYSMNTDGSDRRKLYEDDPLYMNVAGDRIYYAGSGVKGIFSIKTDGSEKTKLSDDSPFQMRVSNGWIYYNNEDDESKLYVMKTDGSNRHKLIDDYASTMNIVGDRIYYIKGDEWKIYSVKTDGSDRKLLSDDKAEWLGIWGNSIYYTRTGAKIYSMNIDGSNKKMIAELDKDAYKKVTFEANTSLHEGMPEYRFVATGLVKGSDAWSTGYVMGLEVYDEKNTQILLEDFSKDYQDMKIGYPVYNQMMDTMGLHITDVNFDGYKDVIILNSFSGAHSNTWYDCWLWDENTCSFVASDSFAEICNPALDSDKKCIYSTGGSGAAYWGGDIYQFLDGKFVVTNELDTDWAGLVEKKLVNGKMKIVREVQFGEDDSVKDEQEYYKNDELWQLDNPRWYWSGGHQADQWLE